MATTESADFLIYGHPYCHLCDQMEAALVDLLQQIGNGRSFAIEVVDLDADEALEALYGEKVPVLMAGGRELCHYHLDAQAVREYLTENR